MKKQIPATQAAMMLKTANMVMRRLVGHPSAMATQSANRAVALAPRIDHTHHVKAVTKLSPLKMSQRELAKDDPSLTKET
jgi:hypothetical protein